MEKRKMIINIDQETFEWLEVLATGLNREKYEDNENLLREELEKGFNKKNNDFAPMVSRLIENLAGSMAEGVMRPESWERGTVEALTGWNGTYIPSMIGKNIKHQIK